ncbi:isopeptide-forming domain-containing fimbrial protein [Streptomyces sp. NPDC021093]|uniref:DUF7927 domain-containing protein n=1 Tax=Streptomyces sp. NPDC021093 TaxID=3365112 RepID=UPI0037B558D0
MLRAKVPCGRRHGRGRYSAAERLQRAVRVVVAMAMVAGVQSAGAASLAAAAAGRDRCDDTAYVLRDSKDGKRRNLGTLALDEGGHTALARTEGLDAMGFNRRDGLLYGVRPAPDGLNSEVVALDPATGTPKAVRLSLTGTGYTAGDATDDGRLIVRADGNLVVVDINPDSPHYLRRTATVPLSGPVAGLADFSYHPGDGALYGVDEAGRLVRVDAESGAVSRHGRLGVTGVGATFLDHGGRFYAAGDRTVQVDLNGLDGAGTSGLTDRARRAVTVATAPSRLLDGAGCLADEDRAPVAADGEGAAGNSGEKSPRTPTRSVPSDGAHRTAKSESSVPAQRARRKAGRAGPNCDDVFYRSVNTSAKTALQAVDLVTGAVQERGTADVAYNALAYDSRSGGLYAAPKSKADTILKIDPATGAATEVPVTGLPSANYTQGAISPDGSVYYLRAGSGLLYSVALTAGNTVTSVRVSTDLGDFAVHPVDGKLYGYNSSGTLYVIDPATGTNTGLGSVPKTGTYLESVAFDELGNLYSIARDGTVTQTELTEVTGGSAVRGASHQSGKTTAGSNADGAGCLIARDRGDAPDSYKTTDASDGPRHLRTPGLTLGTEWDAERGVDTAKLDTKLDDTTGTADEDGLAGTWPTTVTGDTYTGEVAVTNTTGRTATLAGWVDFNANGTFEAAERTTAKATASGTVRLNWTVPSFRSGYLTLRLRLYDGEVTDPAPTGDADGGEVEDHQTWMSKPGSCPNDVWIVNNKKKDLYTWTPEGGVNLHLKGSGSDTTDAIGYNVMDGHLYGMSYSANKGQIVRIDPATGASERFPVAPNAEGKALFATAYEAGVVSPDGQSMYVLTHSPGGGFQANTVNVIDISDPTRPKFVKNIPKVIAHSHDIAFHPEDNHIYQVDNKGKIYRVNPETGEQSTLPTVSLGTSGSFIEGAWFDEDGWLYVYGSSGGSVVRIDLTKTDPATGLAVVGATTAEKIGQIGNYSGPGSDAAGCVPPPLLSTKTVSQATATPGDTLTYTWTIENLAADPKTDVRIEDDLSKILDDADFVEGSLTASSGTATRTGDKITWTNPRVGPHEKITVTYRVKVKNPQPEGADGILDNRILASEGNCRLGSPDARCATRVRIGVLDIDKSADKTTVEPGETVTYTVRVKNPGTFRIEKGTFTDNLDDVLDDAKLTAGPTVSGPGSATVTGDRLTWTGDLDPGQEAVITYTVTVNDPPSGDREIINTITGGGNCAPDSIARRQVCSTTTTVLAPMVQKLADTVEAAPGDKVAYTITLENPADVPINGFTLSDDLADVLDDADGPADLASSHGTAPVFANGKLTWNGTLPAKTTVTLTYSVTVKDSVGGDHVMNNRVVTNKGNCPAGSTDVGCTERVDIDPLSRPLALKKVSDAKSPVKPGEKVTYTVTVTNPNPATYPGARFEDDLTGVLDDAKYNDDATATVGTPSYTAPKLTWTGDIPAKTTVTLTYSVTVNKPTTGDGKLSNAVVGPEDSNCPEGSTDPKCTSPGGEIAELKLKKASDATGAIKPGQKVTYTVTITNTSDTDYPGARFEDDLTGVLDDAKYNEDAAATSGNVEYTAPRLTWTGDVPAGQTVTVTYSVTVNKPLSGDGQLKNAITGPEGSNCEPGSTDPECNSGEGNTAQLAFKKTSDAKSPVKPGDKVTYTVTVTNAGKAAYEGASFEDDLSGVLDDAKYNEDAAATSGNVRYVQPKLSWTGDVPAGGTVTVTYSVTVDKPLTGDKQLKNAVAGPEGSNCEPGSTDEDCTSPGGEVAELKLKKSLDKAGALKPGEKATFTVTVSNTGKADYPGASFEDDLSDVLDDAKYNEDAAATSGNVRYVQPKLSWTGDVKAGETVTITYSVTINKPLTGNGTLGNAVTGPEGSNCEPGSTDPDCETPPGGEIPELKFKKVSDAKSPVKLGDKVTYTVTVSNPGKAEYKGARFEDDLAGVLDDAKYNEDAAATSGSVSYAVPRLTWTGDVPAGQTVTVTYSVTVNKPATGDGKLSNVVVGPEDSNCEPGSTDEDCTSPGGEVAELKFKKSLDKAGVLKPGDKVTFTVTIDNPGTAAYPGASFEDDLSDVLDDATYNEDAAATAGNVRYEAPKLSWTGDVPAGGTVTVTYSVTINKPLSGDGQLGNAVTGPEDSNCAPGSTDPDCETPPGEGGIAELKLKKTSDAKTPVKPGETVTYTVTVSNPGKAEYKGARVEDDLAGVLDDAKYNEDAAATSGNVTYTQPKLSWVGDVPAGGTVTITYSVTVNKPTTGDGKLSNAIVGPEDSNCPEGSTDPKCTSPGGGIAELRFEKASDASGPIKPGQKVTYTVTIANPGKAAYEGARSEDDLTGVLDDAKYNEDAAATSGNVEYAAPRLTWTGDVPAGQTVTVTYSVTVNKPLSGDGQLKNAITGPEGSNCEPGSTDPACDSGEGNTAQLAFKKTSDAKSPVKLGDKVTYTVTVKNSGKAAYEGASFEDDLAGVLDDAKYNDDAAATSGNVTYMQPKLSWSGDVPAGGTVTVTYSVTVNKPATGDGKLSNVVVGPEDSNCEPGSTDEDCTSPGGEVAELKFKKSLDKAGVLKPGDKVTFTVTIDNPGTAAYPGASFEDDLSDVLDDAKYNDDAAATSGNVTYMQPKLSWSGDVPAGGTVTVTYSVTINKPLSGDGQLGNAVVGPEDSNCAPGSTDPDCETPPGEGGIAELKLKKTSDAKSPVNPGDTITYTVTVTNSGKAEFEGARFEDDLTGVLDDATYNEDAAATAGNVRYTAPKLTWTGDVPAGGTVTVTYSVTAQLGGDAQLYNEVTAADSNCQAGEDPASADCSVTLEMPTVEVSKEADKKSVRAGEKVTYTITLRNTSGTPARGMTVRDDLSAVVDDAVLDTNSLSAVSTSGTGVNAPTYDAAGKRLNWTGDIDPGATVTLTYTVTVKPGAELADHVLRNAVTTSLGGCAVTRLSRAGCGTVTPVAALELRKASDASSPVKPGDKVTYTVTVTNPGRAAYVGARFEDDLTEALDDAKYNEDAAATVGNVRYTAPKLTWTGDVPAGGTVTVTYSVTVDDPVTGDHRLANSVVGPNGTNCPEGSTDPACSSTGGDIADLRIKKTSDQDASVQFGDTITYTVTVTNPGRAAYEGARFEDDLTGVVDDASYNQDAAATSGTASYTAPKLSWTGDLAAGASATITYSVRVGLGGDGILRNAVTAAHGNCAATRPGAECSTTHTMPEVEVAKTVDKAVARPGEKVTYTVTLKNDSDADARNVDVFDNLAEVLDDADLDPGSLTATATPAGAPAAPTFDPGTNRLAWHGDVPARTTVTLTYTVTVKSHRDLTDHRLTNTLTTSLDGHRSLRDVRRIVSVTTLVATMELRKSSDAGPEVYPGDKVTYTVQITNKGKGRYSGGSFTDDLTDLLDDSTYNQDATATAGNVSYSTPRLTWTGDIEPGATVTVTYSVTVKPEGSGDGRLTNRVTGTSPGAGCPAGAQDPECATTPVPVRPLPLTPPPSPSPSVTGPTKPTTGPTGKPTGKPTGVLPETGSDSDWTIWLALIAAATALTGTGFALKRRVSHRGRH